MSRKICWVYGNHWNFGIVVADTLRMYNHACIELGLDSSIEKELNPSAHNILLENFTDEYQEKLACFAKKGGRFSIIATELLSEDSFNDITKHSKDKTQYGNSDYWLVRFNNFLNVEKLAESIFHLNPNQAYLYTKFLNRKVEFIPHGYVDGFASVKHRPRDVKDIDILFTGSLTPYRENIINQLSPHCNVYVTDVLTASFHRDDLVARTKVCLNIKQNKAWNVFSNSRGHYHVSNQSFLLTENCTDACPIIDCVAISKINIVDEALGILETGIWHDSSVHSLKKLKNEQSLAYIAKTLLLGLQIW